MAGSPRNKYVQPSQTPVVGFQPNGPYYRSFCCHVRKSTIVFGIIEIFIVCFLLVAVMPDLNSRICGSKMDSEGNSSSTISSSTVLPTVENSRFKRQTSKENFSTTFGPVNNTTFTTYSTTSPLPRITTSTVSPLNEENSTLTVFPLDEENSTLTVSPLDEENSTSLDWSNATGVPNPPLRLLRVVVCECNVVWLSLALVHILSGNLMFYGIKATRWYLFLPHVTMRVFCVLTVLVIVGFLISGFFFGTTSEDMKMTIWVLSIIGVLFCVIYGYVIFVEIKCVHFVRMSAKTGFSVSNTRPVGPPTLSFSETRPPQTNSIPMQNLSRPPASQELPPLRHTYGTGNVGN